MASCSGAEGEREGEEEEEGEKLFIISSRLLLLLLCKRKSVFRFSSHGNKIFNLLVGI